MTSSMWSQLNKFWLNKNKRARDPAFVDFLLWLGNSQLQQESNCFVKLPANLTFSVQTTDPSLISLIEEIFPGLKDSVIDLEIFSQQAILTLHNQDIDAINKEIIYQFAGDPVIYRSFDSALDTESAIYPLEFLHTLSPSGMSPHELVLKKNCRVILLRNLDPSSGLQRDKIHMQGLYCKDDAVSLS